MHSSGTPWCRRLNLRGSPSARPSPLLTQHPPLYLLQIHNTRNLCLFLCHREPLGRLSAHTFVLYSLTHTHTHTPFHFHAITCHPSPPLGRKWPVFLGCGGCFSDGSLFLAVILMDPLMLARDSLERRLLLSAQFGKPWLTPLAKTAAKLKEECQHHLQLNSSVHPLPPGPPSSRSTHPPPPNGPLPNGSLFIAVPVPSGWEQKQKKKRERELVAAVGGEPKGLLIDWNIEDMLWRRGAALPSHQIKTFLWGSSAPGRLGARRRPELRPLPPPPTSLTPFCCYPPYLPHAPHSQPPPPSKSSRLSAHNWKTPPSLPPSARARPRH